MTALEFREQERLRHWQGEKLLSRDFNDQLVDDAHHRWWHNRALHDAYGVAEGFDVYQGSQQAVWVGTGKEQAMTPDQLDCITRLCPSLAYDCFGRELILQRAQTVPWPSRRQYIEDEWWALLVRYRSNSQRANTTSSAFKCPCPVEAPCFEWCPLADLPNPPPQQKCLTIGDLGLDIAKGVPLAVGKYEADNKFKLVNDFYKPPVRPLARAYLARGVTVKGKTNWEPWPVETGKDDAETNQVERGIQVTVDTSTSAFTTAPCYFASLHGATWPPEQAQHCGGSLLSLLLNPSRPNFTFSLWAKDLEQGDECAAKLLNFARRNLYVCWHAVEPWPRRTSCEELLGEAR